MGKDKDMLTEAGIIIEDPGFLRNWSAYHNLEFLYTLPPSSSRMLALPSEKRYTNFFANLLHSFLYACIAGPVEVQCSSLHRGTLNPSGPLSCQWCGRQNLPRKYYTYLKEILQLLLHCFSLFF